MGTAVIVEAVRTPIGRRGGALAGLHAAEILGAAQAALLDRAGVEPAAVEQVAGGCVTQAGEQSNNVTRTAWLHAGLPYQTGCLTLDAQCGSAQQAVHLIAGLIAADAISVGVGCGVEVMSRVPLRSNVGTGVGYAAAGHLGHRPAEPVRRRRADSRGAAACARAEIDAFGLRSQALARAAWAAGTLRPGDHAGEGVRRAWSTGTRACARPAWTRWPGSSRCSRAACTRPGTSSQISDGAAAVLLADAGRARSLGLRPRARIVAQCLIGAEPYYHLDGPIAATQRVLAASGMTLADIDLFEVNEAFAAVVLSWLRVLAARRGAGQRQRRGDRPRPPGGRHRRPADHHRAARA